MANYIIIGGDGKQYGPISGDEVRQWIAEKRLNAQSRVKGEGDAEFRPLSTFPEFAGLFQAPITPPPFAGGAGAGTREGALQQVKGPAMALLVTAILGLMVAALDLVLNIAALTGHQLLPQQQLQDPQMQKIFGSLQGGLGIFGSIIKAAIGVVVLIGAGKMQRLENYQFAMTAAIVGMIPCLSPCCLLGIPFGIWALIVLNKPEVKSQFS
jgi:GYF domain 2